MIINLGEIFHVSTIVMSMDTLGHPHIPVHTVLYHLPITVIKEPTPTTTVVPSISAKYSATR